MQSNVGWEEFTQHIDRLIHDYGKYMIFTLIFFVALIFWGIGYLATHKFSEADKQEVSQEISQ